MPFLTPTGRSDRSTPHRSPAAGLPVARITVAVMLLVLALTGCSVRLDTPPPPVPTPDDTEQARAALAEQTETLVTLADAAGGEQGADQDGENADGSGQGTATDPEVAAELAAIAAASEEQLAALGGLWTPPPRPDDPSPTPTVQPTATPQDVLAALAEASTQVQEAVGESFWDAETATLLASIAVYRDGALARLADALGTSAPTPPEPSGDLPAELTAASAPLCRTLDGLGYVYEVQAARSDGDQRAQAATRAETNRALAEQVAVHGDYDGTADDPRQASYAVGEDLNETITRWQSELLPAWLALIGPAAPADRPLLLTQARAAAALAPPPAEMAFPGLQAD